MALHHRLRTLALQVLVALFFTACTTTISQQPTTLEQPRGEKQAKEVAPLYYDFKDVPVPRQLDIINEKSFVFQTAESTVGRISLSGRLNAEFLIDFFSSRMPRNSCSQ